MSLRPETRDSLTAASQTLADDFACGLPHAKKALWVAVCRYVQPFGMTGDVKHDTINPADVDAAYLDLRETWDTDPPPKVLPEPPADLPPPSRCRSCRAQIRWGQRGPKKHPFNLDGVTSHFDTCPDASRWRPKKGAA